MSGILFLGNDDFQVRQGDKGQILSLTYESKGLTLVLYYSTECPYCDNLINKFKQLPSFVNGCQFAMVNVSRNMDIVERSKNTIAPISYVPDVILYVNGAPYVRYDGPHDIQHIKDFIVDIYKKIQKTAFMEQEMSQNRTQYPTMQPQEYQAPQQNMQNMQNSPPMMMGKPQMQQQQPHHPQQQQNIQLQKANPNPIPAYTIGTPLYGEKKREKVCYLNFNSAYVSAST